MTLYALVSSGCHDKTPQTGRLKQQTFTSSWLEAGKSELVQCLLRPLFLAYRCSESEPWSIFLFM